MQWKTVDRIPEESVRPPLSPRSNQTCDPVSIPRIGYQEWRRYACDTEHSHCLILNLNIHHDIFLHSPVGFPMPWRWIQHRCNFSYIKGLHILSLNLQPHCYKANRIQKSNYLFLCFLIRYTSKCLKQISSISVLAVG